MPRTDSFSLGFLTVLQKLRQQLMALENKFIAIYPITEANYHESHSNSGPKTAYSKQLDRKTTLKAIIFYAKNVVIELWLTCAIAP